MKGKIRWIILSILILVISGMGILVYKNKDNWFMSKTTIEYPDGCIEEYEGTKLLADECTEGRDIVENNRANYIKDRNYSMGTIIDKWNLTTSSLITNNLITNNLTTNNLITNNIT